MLMAKAYKKYCELIEKLDGVLNVKFVGNEKDDIVELHVLASKSIHPKQLVRNIESALLSKFDYTIDRKIISIAQIESELYISPERIRFLALNLRYTSNSEVVINVELQKDGETFSSSESVNAADTDIKTAVANATLSSVHKYLNNKNIFKIVKIQSQVLCDKEIIISIVNCHENKASDELLVGVCMVSSDPNIATVKSVLNTINREIELLLYNNKSKMR
jgi:hypothetical protein